MDISQCLLNGQRSFISVETLFEKAPDELKNFIIFNLDLFQSIDIVGEPK
jgi:hypothetical protein